MIHICAHCKKDFKESPRPWRVTYCSMRCRTAGKRKFTNEQLQQIAFSGELQTRIASAAGVDPHRVKREMEQAGVYQLWQEQKRA